MTMKRIATALLVTAFGLAASAAQAQQTDSSTVERTMFQGLLSGLGIIDNERPVIDYRERAPLVLPRNSALPAPQESAASRNPSWPNDPDVARARALGLSENSPIVRDDLGRTLTNGELRARQGGGWFGGGPVDTTRDRSQQQQAGPASAAEMGVRPIWQQVGSLFGPSQQDAVVPFPGEPTRRRLVEPPPGYRTASPDAPYGPVGRRPEDPSAAYNRQPSGQDPARMPGSN
ncbi:hypothetical protein BN1110_01818 [bacterium YEK0313]|nr:hypothetical protein BN1110_01818 [bacterium YEK0313]